MTLKNADTLDALRKIEDTMLGVFRAAACEPVAPDILQPAGPFLDRLGENVRSRTYVFTDLDGAELCLRPDLTIPVSRIYLKSEPDCENARRFCYAGPAFRFQPDNAGKAHPREFDQAGIEIYGEDDAQGCEAEATGLTARAIAAAGVTRIKLQIGDPGLFTHLLEATEMPARWRRRLHHQFWRPDAFRELLTRLGRKSAHPADTREQELLGEVAQSDLQTVAMRVRTALEKQGIPLFGGRTVEEIAMRLIDHAADRAENPLPEKQIKRLERYLEISAPPRRALDRIAKLMREEGLDLVAELEAFSRRLDLLEAQGFNLDEASFSAEFGRQFEYYTGFVFQIEAQGGGIYGPLAGGGRYDDLLTALGAKRPVPAMGAAINTERVLMARDEGAS